MSPLGSGWVLKPPGTSTGVPSKVVHGFQSLYWKPKNDLAPPRPTTSTPKRRLQSGAISPSIWYASVTLTGVPGGSSFNAWRSLYTLLTCIPVTALAPRSKGTRSGC